MQHLTGIGVSPGLALGRAVVAIQRTQVIRFPIGRERVDRELAALAEAREQSRQQLLDIRERIARSPGAELVPLFDAQLLILDDPMLVGRAAEVVRHDHVNAEWAVQRVLDELVGVFDAIEDAYLRDRKADMADVAARLRMNLRQAHVAPRDLFRDLAGPYVLIADELTPSAVAQMDWTNVRGFATDAGSRTYHTAILARSLRVPAVVGLHDISRRVVPGTEVIIDGESGEVIIDATAEQIAETAGRASRVSAPPPATAAASGPTQTADGVRVTLEANIDLLDDLSTAVACGAEGVGLYRSEFLLSGAPPEAADEQEQYTVYRHMVERMAPRPVTIRTFDIDERQLALPSAHPSRWFREEREAQRAGLRGIRLGLAYPDLLRTQLRAMVRAAAHGPVRILLPFVSVVEEVRAARAELERVRGELRASGTEPPQVPLGVMIEVPSAACTADLLAEEADFLTIGTNDLIQYALAVDRTDERVSDRYKPLEPAVLRMIRQVTGAARRRGVPLSLCGEMASDPVLLALLVGCGLTSFSMTPGAISLAREVVTELRVGEMRRLIMRVLRLRTVAEIEACLVEALGTRDGRRALAPK